MKYSTLHHWRGHLINDLIIKYGYKSYLEIGVLIGTTFNSVQCENKIGVDPDPKIPSTIPVTSDEFFQTNTTKFDIVLIDGCHEKNQVYNDFKNSFRFLNDNGVIIFHDINPTSESGTSLSGHGDCYELWMNMVSHYKLYTYLSTDNDCVGLFFKKLNPILLDFETKTYNYRIFDQNRKTYIHDLIINDNLEINHE